MTRIPTRTGLSPVHKFREAFCHGLKVHCWDEGNLTQVQWPESERACIMNHVQNTRW